MILVDGNPVLYRSWHTQELTTSKGYPSGLVHGSLKILLALFKKFQGEQITVFWDLGKSEYRTAKYPEYKKTPGRSASRTKPGYPEDAFHVQVLALKDILSLLGVRQVQVEGIEADDLIAVSTTTDAGPFTVVTDDLDMYQLITDDTVRVYSPRKETWISSREQCKQETGLLPEQIIDYKALSGDASDNIPGVPSVGEKTAKTILAHCGSVPEMYRRLHSGETPPVGRAVLAKITEHEGDVKLWYDLCRVLTWDMFSESQKNEYLRQWTAPAKPVDRVGLVQSLEAWELREFLSGLEDNIRIFRPDEMAMLVGSGEAVAWNVVDPPDPRPSLLKSLGQIHERVLACTACPLRAECRTPVPGNTDTPELPTIMVVGRNPGENEDRLGRGFVGRSGQRLDRLLEGKNAEGKSVQKPLLDRSKLWITNVVHCFSIGNRPPTPEEWKTCANLHLREEIETIRPRLILSFGSEAMAALTGHEDSIMRRAGTVVLGSEADGIVQYRVADGEREWAPVIPPECQILLFPHPSAALRTRAVEIRFEQVGRVLEGILEGLGT